MHRHTGTLSPTPPFDFAQTLAFLRDFAPLRGEQVLGARTLTKAIMVAGQAVGVELRAAGTIETPRLDYTLHAPAPLDNETIAAAEDRLAFLLGLDDNLRPFYAIGHTDPAFAPVIERLYGYHQLKFPTPFEAACWAILTQRTPLAIAARQKAALTARYGEMIPIDGVDHATFPEAARLDAAGPEALAELVGTARRADYLFAAAAAFATTDERWLRSAPWEEVERWLRAIKGIGAWSAIFILIRGLGRMAALPRSERRHNAIVSHRYLHGQHATDEAIARIAAPYGEWRGYWAHYLRAAG